MSIVLGDIVIINSTEETINNNNINDKIWIESGSNIGVVAENRTNEFIIDFGKTLVKCDKKYVSKLPKKILNKEINDTNIKKLNRFNIKAGDKVILVRSGLGYYPYNISRSNPIYSKYKAVGIVEYIKKDKRLPISVLWEYKDFDTEEIINETNVYTYYDLEKYDNIKVSDSAGGKKINNLFTL